MPVWAAAPPSFAALFDALVGQAYITQLSCNTATLVNTSREQQALSVGAE